MLKGRTKLFGASLLPSPSSLPQIKKEKNTNKIKIQLLLTSQAHATHLALKEVIFVVISVRKKVHSGQEGAVTNALECGTCVRDYAKTRKPFSKYSSYGGPLLSSWGTTF